jgi:hypothetical protein
MYILYNIFYSYIFFIYIHFNGYPLLSGERDIEKNNKVFEIYFYISNSFIYL